MKWWNVPRSMFAAMVFLCVFMGEVRAQAYYHDSWDLPLRTDWMKQLPDDRRLSEMTIPGTHDSAAFRNGGDIALTQSLTITQQLKGGVRFLDLRVRHIHDVFAMHHGAVYQGAMFGDVLQEMTAFLRRHPSETIVVRLKEEHEPAGNTRSFEQTFKSYYAANQQWFARTGESDPPLGALRGKIWLLADFRRSDYSYGRSYAALRAQDAYAVSANSDLYGKWEKVKAHLRKSAADRSYALYINYLSASGGAFPYFIASGKSSPGTGASQLLTGLTTIGAWRDVWPDFPRTACLGSWCTIEYLGTNALTAKLLNGMSWRGLGIVAADFPGPYLIGALVRANDGHRSNRLLHASTGLCIDVAGALRPGSALQLAQCRRGAPGQDIRIDDLRMRVGGPASRLCIDMRSGRPIDHQPVVLYGCHGETNQQWALREDGRIQSQRPSPDLRTMCLTVEGYPSRLTVRPCGLDRYGQVFAVEPAVGS